MTPFLKTKAGIVSVMGFMALMALVLARVTQRHRHTPAKAAAPANGPVAATSSSSMRPAPVPEPPKAAALRDPAISEVAENAANLDQFYDLDRRLRQDRDRQGNSVTRRENARTPGDAGTTSEDPLVTASTGAPRRPSLRLQGRRASSIVAAVLPTSLLSKTDADRDTMKAHLAEVLPTSGPEAKPRSKPRRFNPYGAVIKCELVFTLDSTTEETPLIAVVMEPVYNNGALVIPAGAEFHGTARPDRLRDRIFSGQDWILVFPRERDRISGRQLTVRGVALDRVEPDANGMTWGITDGSYGLEGKVIRSLADEEIKRFVATFLAAGAETMQERQTDRGGQQSVRNTPQNAVLQGLGANFQKVAEEISAEIAQHGVFIRIPAGHQFYFYPMQIIDPDAADISSDVATVK